MEPTVSAILAAGAVGGFAVTAITCWLLIPALHRLHFGQTIREEGPTWHNKKNGTPTMGGLGFIFGILLTIGVVYGLFHSSAPEVLGPQQMAAGMLVLFLAFGNGLIGFLDDFIKVIKHRNLGLTAGRCHRRVYDRLTQPGPALHQRHVPGSGYGRSGADLLSHRVLRHYLPGQCC